MATTITAASVMRTILGSATLTLILAICSTMVSNGFYLSTSYIVKNKKVAAGEITIFSALLRILIFGIWSAKIKCTQIFSNEPSGGNGYDVKSWISLIASNLSIAITILLCYIAVTLMPLSDFIVFGFTSPVFTLMFSMACNR